MHHLVRLKQFAHRLSGTDGTVAQWQVVSGWARFRLHVLRDNLTTLLEHCHEDGQDQGPISGVSQLSTRALSGQCHPGRAEDLFPTSHPNLLWFGHRQVPSKRSFGTCLLGQWPHLTCSMDECAPSINWRTLWKFSSGHLVSGAIQGSGMVWVDCFNSGTFRLVLDCVLKLLTSCCNNIFWRGGHIYITLF